MVAVSLICITITAMAQEDPVVASRYSDRFPQLPPLNIDLMHVLAYQHHPGLLIMSFQSSQQDTTDVPQSLMFRRLGPNAQSHFIYKPSNKYDYQNGDALKGVRDRIVRKRMADQGRPLPPPVPWGR